MEPIRSEYENDSDMLEIVKEFASELPERMVALEQSLSSGDLAKLETLAHQLKGAGGGYGFPQITDAAAVLESALREGADASVIEETLQQLGQVLKAVEISETA